MSKSADEVLIEIKNNDDQTYYKLIEDMNEYLNLDIRVETFQLEQIGKGSHYLKRDIHTNLIIDIKGVEGYLYPQILRRLFNESIQEQDLVFYAEKRLAKFLGEYDENYS